MFFRIAHSGFVDAHGAARPANTFHAVGNASAAKHVLQLSNAGARDAAMIEISEEDYRAACRAALVKIRTGR